jgi:hypothetical protein
VIEGAVISFIDITEIVHARDALQSATTGRKPVAGKDKQ